MCHGAAEGSRAHCADSAGTDSRGMVEGTRLLLTLQEGLTKHSSKHSPSCFLYNACFSVILCTCIIGGRGLPALHFY